MIFNCRHLPGNNLRPGCFLLMCLLPLDTTRAQEPASAASAPAAPLVASVPTVSPAGVPADAPAPTAEAPVSFEVVTFDSDPGKLFVPLAEAAKALGWTIVSQWPERNLVLNGVVIPATARRMLLNKTELIETAHLALAGAEVSIHPSGQSATVSAGGRQFLLMRAEKRVEVSLGEQRLRAWQGSRLVMETNISSGRNGGTPSGNFVAGPYKSRMHRSRLYHNAPMPWSVQLNGHVFIHGFTSVPDYPASHGCIRMPLTGRNPARLFYEWVDAGTPVAVLPVPKKEKDKKAITKK